MGLNKTETKNIGAFAGNAGGGGGGGSHSTTINEIESTSGSISLETNKVYTVTLSGNAAFTLPSTVDDTIFNQIFVQAQITQSITLDLGTANYLGEEPSLEAGDYNIVYEYDNNNSAWFVGALKKTVAVVESTPAES